jgi:methylase of polypeptide subunit release factors
VFAWWYGPYARRRIAQGSDARLLGRWLFTDPEVLHPVFFRSTGVLIDRLLEMDIAGKRFLDMGSGSGAIGIFAGSCGARVTACDISPRAVALTRDNLRRHHVNAEVFQSDLFSALEGRAFDLICFNIPFYEGEPRTLFEAALFGGRDLATVGAFASGCPGFLAPDGEVLVIFSEDADRDRILSVFAAAELAVVDERNVYRLFERFHVVRFRRMTLAHTADSSR